MANKTDGRVFREPLKQKMTAANVMAVVVFHARPSLLRKSLHCLEQQTVKPLNIVIVDNSEGGDLAWSALGGAKVLSLRRNIGFAAGNNLGLGFSDADFFALINPDAFPERDWLEKLLEAARMHPEVAAFGSLQLIDERPEFIDGLGDTYHPSGIFRREGHGRRRADCSNIASPEIFSPCAAAALYRRDAVLAVGGFDEDFFCYGEDVDLGFRLRLVGWKSMLVRDAVVRHVGSASSGGQRSDFATYHGHRNMVWVYCKNMPTLLFLLFLPLHLLANIASVAVLILRGQGKVAWRAKRDAIKGLPAMWKKRRVIQAGRKVGIFSILSSLRWA